jgi:hypothetical protein
LLHLRIRKRAVRVELTMTVFAELCLNQLGYAREKKFEASGEI